MGGITYFTATTAAEGRELWRSDGTAQGTKLLADIEPGLDGSSPKDLLVVGKLLFFTALSEAHGRELWQSDGTQKGTVLVSDIRYGKEDSNIREMTALGKTLIFVADDGKNGLELWKSQGGGATLVSDICKGALGSEPKSLTVANSLLFFTAYEPLTGRELWKSDGTILGTVLVADLGRGTSRSYLSKMIGTSSLLFFSFRDVLWKSDGTWKGTAKVPNVGPGTIFEWVRLGNRLLYAAYSVPAYSYQVGLYITDGTLFSTLVKPAPGRWLSGLRVFGSTAFYYVSGSSGTDLWKTDGTSKNTALVKSGQVLQMAAFGKMVAILTARPPSSPGFDLWLSDGTAKGTVLATSFKNLRPKMYSSGSERAREQRRSDGCEAGPQMDRSGP